MQVIQMGWWMLLSLSLLFCLIEALNYADLGFPNNSSCAFNYNNTLYIIGANNNVSISFGNPWDIDPPKVLKQNNNTTARIACAITKSGKLVLLPLSNSNPLQVIDNNISSLTWQSNQNITYQGSQNAINKFVTKSLPISNFAVVSFKDYILIQAETTFILDTRFPTQWTWYELLATSLAPPPLPSTSHDSLFATSRWILHFRTSTRFSSTGNLVGYTTVINCFDPLSFIWLGEILTFNTTTNLIQATQIQSSIEGSDSLLLLPSWSIDTQELNLITNNHAETIFWKLDISTWIHTNVTLSPILISNNESVVLKGTVTRLYSDLVVFYKVNTIQFFNTTNFNFTSQPQWLYTSSDNSGTTSKNDLAIILGSIMGSILFIAILILFIYCWLKKRKRSRDRSVHLPRHIDNQKNKCLHWPLLPSREKNPGNAGWLSIYKVLLLSNKIILL
jgi:hypothetical protein